METIRINGINYVKFRVKLRDKYKAERISDKIMKHEGIFTLIEEEVGLWCVYITMEFLIPEKNAFEFGKI